MEGSGSASSRLGKYELRGELGRGAMGVVYRAYDTVLRRNVALKTMSAPTSDRAQTERFLREARTAGGLHHPNIVTIHELGHDSGQYYIAMELLEGRNLRQVMEAEQLPPMQRRLEIVARLCDGLDYAHRAGIVHRDIKPANIFLLDDRTVKILDFGIAKIAASDTTRTGMLIGSVDYMSPEQVQAVKDLDGRSDIFSAGAILYELLLRRRPFAADDLGAALNRILHKQPPGYSMFDRFLPAGLADVLRRSLDKRREARYPRAAEMATALDSVASTLSGRAGTELAERIEEIVASGALEHRDREPGVEVISSRCETKDDPSLDTAAVTQTPTLSARRILLGSAIVIVLIGTVVVTGLWQSADPPRQEPLNTLPPVTVAEPEPNLPQTSDFVAPAPVVPAVGIEPEPVESAPPAPPTEPPSADDRPVAPPAPGTLEVRVMPWANLVWIENLDTGERTPSDLSTPVRLELPAGRYRLRLVNPYAAGPVDLEATVRGHETAEIRHTLPGFYAADLTREILAREGSSEEAKR